MKVVPASAGRFSSFCCHHLCLRSLQAAQRSNQQHLHSVTNRPICRSQSGSDGHQTDSSKKRLPVGASQAALHPKRFIGVERVKSGKFHAKTFSPIHGQQRYLGMYIDAEEAAKAVDTAKIFLGKEPVNFDIDDFDPVEIRASAATFDEYIAGMKKQKGLWSSRFKGVSKAKGGKYCAHLTLHGKPNYLGSYMDAAEAAKAVDATRMFLGQDPVNFNTDDFDPVEIRTSASTLDGFIAGVKRQRDPGVKESKTAGVKEPKTAGMEKQENAESSRFVNVVKKPDANNFRAYILLQHKQVHLGYFPDEDQAARAVDVAKIYMDKGMLNFPKEEYNVADIKALASTFDDLVATLRLEARHAASGYVAAYRRRAAKERWQYDIWKYKGLWSACLYLHGPKKNLGFYTSWDGAAIAVDRALLFLGEKPRCMPHSQYNAQELYRELRTPTSNFEEFARGERQHADRALREASRLVPGKRTGCIQMSGKGFQARCRHDGSSLHLGSFVHKDNAARAIDRFLIYTGWYPAHFPLDEYNVDKIRSSASTVDEFKHDSRLEAQ